MTSIVFGAAILASCSSTPSVANFDSQANSTCQSFVPALRTIDAALALSVITGSKKLRTEVPNALPAAESGASSLKSLAPPNGFAAGLKKAQKLQDDQVADLSSIAKALRGEDSARLQSAESSYEDTVAPLNQIYDGLGMTSCGSGSVPTSH